MWFGSVDLSEISCIEVLEEIELYIDGELESDRAAHLAEHLRTCSPCMRHAEFQAKLKDIVRTKCRSETPEHLMVRIRVMLRREDPRPK